MFRSGRVGFELVPTTSGLPQTTDILRVRWHISKVPRGDIAASACDVRNVPIRPVAVTAPFFDCPGITDEIYECPCARYSSSARRHAPGVMPTNWRKIRVRWL